MAKPASKEGPYEPAVKSLTELPTVAFVFDLPHDDDDFSLTGPVTDLAGANKGVLFRVNDNRRKIAEAIGVEPLDVIGRGIAYGRLILSNPEIVSIAPVVYTRVGRTNDFGYHEGVVLSVSGSLIESGTVQLAQLPDGFTDLEGTNKPIEVPPSPRHDSRSFTAGAFMGPK